ncbi:MAG: hypothetical protein H0T46_21165 [Deltaproteobacteria bacterium]|nr:hypothetical protein [Deltaproteobacteria bacterium]
MSRLILAIVMVIGMGRLAAAERIAVTAVDRSQSGLTEAERTANADTVKRALVVWADAEGIDGNRRLDVGVVRMSVEPGDEAITIVAELRLGVSDAQGRIVSLVSGSASVAVPSAAYRAKNLPKLRREALLAATMAMLPKLRPQLTSVPQARAPTPGVVQRLATRWDGSRRAR